MRALSAHSPPCCRRFCGESLRWRPQPEDGFVLLGDYAYPGSSPHLLPAVLALDSPSLAVCLQATTCPRTASRRHATTRVWYDRRATRSSGQSQRRVLCFSLEYPFRDSVSACNECWLIVVGAWVRVGRRTNRSPSGGRSRRRVSHLRRARLSHLLSPSSTSLSRTAASRSLPCLDAHCYCLSHSSLSLRCPAHRRRAVFAGCRAGYASLGCVGTTGKEPPSLDLVRVADTRLLAPQFLNGQDRN